MHKRFVGPLVWLSLQNQKHQQGRVLKLYLLDKCSENVNIWYGIVNEVRKPLLILNFW